MLNSVLTYVPVTSNLKTAKDIHRDCCSVGFPFPLIRKVERERVNEACA